MRQDKRSYSALASNSPNSTLIHRLSTAQALNDRGARQFKLPETPSETPVITPFVLFLPGQQVNPSGLPAFRRKKRAI